MGGSVLVYGFLHDSTVWYNLIHMQLSDCDVNIQYSSCMHILFSFIAHNVMCNNLCQKLEIIFHDSVI